MGEFTVDWFDVNTPHLERILAPFCGRPFVRMLEIGAYEGRSTVWFLESILTGPESHLTTVDTWQGSAENDPLEMAAVRERFEHNTARFVASGRLTVAVASSQRFLAARVADFPRDMAGHGFHIIYIDGSHAAPDVLSDAVLSWALLEPGGVLVFDDYFWDLMPTEQERPRFAIDSFLACFLGQYDEVHRGGQIGVRKHMPEASSPSIEQEHELISTPAMGQSGVRAAAAATRRRRSRFARC